LEDTNEPYVPTTREISKLVTFYLKNVRAHDKSEMVGIIRQIQLMVKKGITMEDISLAMQNYASDDFTKNNHPALRHHIRKFMMPEKIRMWKNPPKRQATFAEKQRATDPSLSRLDALEAKAPAPVTVAVPTRVLYDDPDGTDDAL
jgi:hypothetical protein